MVSYRRDFLDLGREQPNVVAVWLERRMLVKPALCKLDLSFERNRIFGLVETRRKLFFVDVDQNNI